MNNDLYYLYGVYLGDGHIDYDNYAYQFIITAEDEDLCCRCNEICNSIIGRSGTISLEESYYKLVVCSKDLCNKILDIFCTNPDYNKADKIEKKSKLPKLINEQQKHSFVRGLMDSDGWISERANGKYTKYEIGFKNTSLLTPAIYEIMKSIGLKCNKLDYNPAPKRYDKPCKARWTWTINTRNFIEVLGFGIARKVGLSYKYLEYINNGHAKKNS